MPRDRRTGDLEVTALLRELCPPGFLDAKDWGLCQDCGNPSDLGRKCSDCYRQWKQLLWSDIPARQAELLAIAKDLNQAPEQVSKAIAEGRPSGLAGSHAELNMRVRRALEGPFGETLKAKLEAIRVAATTAKRGKTAATNPDVVD